MLLDAVILNKCFRPEKRRSYTYAIYTRSSFVKISKSTNNETGI